MPIETSHLPLPAGFNLLHFSRKNQKTKNKKKEAKHEQRQKTKSKIKHAPFLESYLCCLGKCSAFLWTLCIGSFFQLSTCLVCLVQVSSCYMPKASLIIASISSRCMLACQNHLRISFWVSHIWCESLIKLLCVLCSSFLELFGNRHTGTCFPNC